MHVLSLILDVPVLSNIFQFILWDLKTFPNQIRYPSSMFWVYPRIYCPTLTLPYPTLTLTLKKAGAQEASDA